MINLYTDGACKSNPGKGGWGVVIEHAGAIKEFHGGCYELTTNNRMEMAAVIEGIKHLGKIDKKIKITVYSDSKYVIDSISKGWAKGWKARGWIKSDKQKAKNIDLWTILLELCENYNLDFKWVKGHDGNTLNERCDFLCNKAIEESELVQDEGYLKNEVLNKDNSSPDQMSLF